MSQRGRGGRVFDRALKDDGVHVRVHQLVLKGKRGGFGFAVSKEKKKTPKESKTNLLFLSFTEGKRGGLKKLVAQNQTSQDVSYHQVWRLPTCVP